MNVFGFLLILAVIALVWWNAIGVRTAARRVARRACADAGVGFIDEIRLHRLRLGYGARGRLGLRRVYKFEFFVDRRWRYTGYVHMQGGSVAAVRMDPYPM